MTTDELADLVDYEKIRDRLARLSRGLDRRDGDLIAACYWPEATDDQGVAITTVDELVAWVVPGDPAIVLTVHTLGQSLIELRGSTALAETHVTAYHRISTGGEDRDIMLGGRYLDRLEKRGQDWRIMHRKLLSDWHNDLGRSADWSTGLLGMAFRSENAIGTARGDASVAFFAQQ